MITRVGYIKMNLSRLLQRNLTTASVKSFNDIPGPFRLPVFGNLYLYKLGFYKIEEYHNVLKQLYYKYGPIVKQNLGSDKTIVHIFEPEDAKIVYQNEGKVPTIAPLQETVKQYRQERNLSLGLGNTNGEEWYRLRSAVRQMMLRPKEVQYYLPMINEAADNFVNRIRTKRSNSGEISDLRNEAGKWSRESAGLICFETKLGCFTEGETEKQAQEAIDLNKKIFELSAQLKFSYPWYRFIKTPMWSQLLEAEDKFNSFGLKLIEETVKRIRKLQTENQLPENQYSFMSYLLSKEHLSDKDVTIITMSMFSDGLSTTVPTFLFNLHCLAKHPQVQETAYKQIKSVIKDNETITEQHLNRLPYIKAIVKETFRVLPNGTEISRITDEEMVLSGYHIPKKTHLNLNLSVLFDSEKYFHNPGEYEPERWLRESGKEVHPYLLVPFGHGTRTCAGRRFAEQDLYVAITKILQRFHLEYPQDAKPLQPVYQTLIFPKERLPIRFLDRKN